MSISRGMRDFYHQIQETDRSCADSRFFQTFRHIGGLQRCDHFVQIAVDHAIQIMKRQAYAMICDAILRKIVGTNFFFASASTDLATPLRAVSFRFLAVLSLEQPRS